MITIILMVKFKFEKVKVCEKIYEVFTYGPSEGSEDEECLTVERVSRGFRMIMQGDFNGWIGDGIW